MTPTPKDLDAGELIRLLDLKPLPEEGGFFRETYKSAKQIPARFLSPEKTGTRSFTTCIYYLITPTSFSSLHRVTQDEIFHFYLGDPVEMMQIDAEGKASVTILGPDLRAGHSFHGVVPGEVWQATRLLSGGRWALLGTTVSPGFEFADFELGDPVVLGRQFPAHARLLERFHAR